MHSRWSVSPVATTILSGMLSQYRLILARFFYGAESYLVEDYGVVAVVVELTILVPSVSPPLKNLLMVQPCSWWWFASLRVGHTNRTLCHLVSMDLQV